MTLSNILVFSVFALLVGWLLPTRWRARVLMASSLAAIYWLQPSTPIRNLDFWLPTASIVLTILVWAVTRPGQNDDKRPILITSGIVLGTVLLIGLTRYIEPLCCLTPSRPPGVSQIAIALGAAAILAIAACWLSKKVRFIPGLAILILLAFFVILKTEPLAQAASAWLRALTGQSAELASAVDIPWLGFSYLAFRLLHVLRDAQTGKLPDYSLDEFVAYAIFFPTYTAGPIDRSERFIQDLRQPVCTPDQSPNTATSPPAGELRSIPRADYGNIGLGGQRLIIGIFKKFVLADSLALIALSAQNAGQVTSSAWMWVLLYAYALRIYFDFSGYTDVALGLGRLMGFKLPENFERPYLKQNLTAFWNSWHITLAAWFRAYFFNPLTRSLRTSPRKLPTWSVILIGQFSTMLLIGLWHGLSWNFAIWGLWHGAGLFIHNRWSAWSRPRLGILEKRPLLKQAAQMVSWFLTFQYVVLGWVWFALPSPELAWTVFLKLAGR